MLLNIMTWNTGITESKEKHLENIIKYIKDYLEKDNSIAFLQQFPFKIYKKNTHPKDWEISPQYNRLIEVFSESDYKILANTFYKEGGIVMMTVSITKNMRSYVGELDKDSYPEYFQTSRESAVSFCKKGSSPKKESLLDILGIHARNGKDNQVYLNNLNNVDVGIVLGDFNAGDYLESENRAVFNNILKGYVCICDTATRVYKRSGKRTCIDHVFVKDALVTKCGNLIVHEDICFSDHFPISFTLQLEV